MSAPEPDQPTTLYVVHRGVFAGVAIAIAVAVVLVLLGEARGVGAWAASTIGALHATWTSWHWSLL